MAAKIKIQTAILAAFRQRLCLSIRYAMKIIANAARYSHPVWPCNSSHPRGAGDQSGRGGGALRPSQNILQRRRARRPQRLPCEHRKGCQGSENESAGTVPPSLNPIFHLRTQNTVGSGPLAPQKNARQE